MNFPKFQYRLQLFLLGLGRDLRTCFGLFNTTKNRITPEKILISGLVLLGDLVLISPLFQALKQEFPKASIELLVPEGWGEFAQHFKNIDQVFESKKNNPHWLRDFKNQYKNRWQLGVIPWSYASINLFYALNINQIRSFPDPKNRRPYRIHQKINLPKQADYFSRMTLSLSSSAEDSYKAPHFNLANIPITSNISSAYVIIHPGASNLTKYWGAENYAAIAHYLISLGYQIILTGTTPEKEITEKIKLHIPTCLNLAGKTKLHELLFLISQAQLVLGPDTGVLHLTRALNIPSITLMGPTQPKIYGPHPDFHNLEITKALSVSQNQALICQDARTIFKHQISGVANCRRPHCLYPETHCMTGLTQDAVKQLIHQILKI